MYSLTGTQDKFERTVLGYTRSAADAGFLEGNRSGCSRGTRGDVLFQIEQWLEDSDSRPIFWLNGPAGSGKSTIAQTFAETSFFDGKLGASFFCSRDFYERSELRAIFPTLAFQLAHRYPQFLKPLVGGLQADPESSRESLFSQFDKLIIRPLLDSGISTLIIIDALDECREDEPASSLLVILSHFVDEIPGIKFLITSRPEHWIRCGFRLPLLHLKAEVLKLHNIERSLVDEDIRSYLRVHLTNIRNIRSDCEFPEEWPTPYDINILCKKANGLFLYASTVVKFVASKYHLPTERLDFLLLPSQAAHYERGIDLLYTQILERAFLDIDPSEQEFYSDFRIIVGAVLLVFHPLSSKALSDLLGTCLREADDVSTILDPLRSLLDVPDNEDDPIRVFHESFSDFLTDPARCKSQRFFVDPSIQHKDILFSCFYLMRERLKKNMCGLDDYAVLSDVEDLSARRERCIGSSLEYACRFWTRHLASIPGNGPHVKQIQEAIDEFFAERLLCWIEVLSTVGDLGAAAYAISNIRQWYISVSHTQVYSYSINYPHTFLLGRHLHSETSRRHRRSRPRAFRRDPRLSLSHLPLCPTPFAFFILAAQVLRTRV